jgi:hypothetical protein
MGLLGVARANTSVGGSPETFLLLLVLWEWSVLGLNVLSLSRLCPALPGTRIGVDNVNGSII